MHLWISWLKPHLVDLVLTRPVQMAGAKTSEAFAATAASYRFFLPGKPARVSKESFQKDMQLPTYLTLHSCHHTYRSNPAGILKQLPKLTQLAVVRKALHQQQLLVQQRLVETTCVLTWLIACCCVIHMHNEQLAHSSQQQALHFMILLVGW